MKKIFIIIIFMVYLCPLFFLLSNCGKGKKDIPRIRIASAGTPDVLDLPLFHAKKGGFFEKNGLNVKIESIGGDADVINAVTQKNSPFILGKAGSLTILQKYAEGTEIVGILAPQRTHDYALISSSIVKVPKDLKGKRVGIYGYNDITEYLILAYLNKKNIDQSQISFIPIGGSENRYRALKDEVLDAVPLHVDLAAKALNNIQNVHELASLATEVPSPMSFLFVKKDSIEPNLEILIKIGKSISSATRELIKVRKSFIQTAQSFTSIQDTTLLIDIHKLIVEKGIYAIDGVPSEEGMKNAINIIKNQLNIKIVRDPDEGFVYTVLKKMGDIDKS